MFSIDHIGVAVKSLTAAKAIYEKLGLKLAPEETVEGEQVRVVMVPLGESRMELLEPTSENSVIAKFIAKRGEGLHHISLRVPNLEAAVQRLKKDGIRLVSDEIKIGAGGHRYVFVHPSSAGGVLLELVEWQAESECVARAPSPADAAMGLESRGRGRPRHTISKCFFSLPTLRVNTARSRLARGGPDNACSVIEVVP